MLYIGRLHDIEDKELRAKVIKFCNPTPDQQLIIETELGVGVNVSPLDLYSSEHLRICRPRDIPPKAIDQAIKVCINKLGHSYGVRHMLDLGRLWYHCPRFSRNGRIQY